MAEYEPPNGCILTDGEMEKRDNEHESSDWEGTWRESMQGGRLFTTSRS